jgi:Ca2+-binding EF-hand superfamily protein
MQKTLAIAAASMVAITGAAYAHNHDDPAKPMTRAEVQAKVKTHFDKFDASKDGVVTRAEFDAARAQMREEWQAKAVQRQGERFTMLDANKDGQIGRAEFDADHQARAADRAGDRKGGEKRWGHHGGKGMGMGMGMGMGWFERIDTDNDGRVTLADASKKALEMFDKADANRDGTVTPEERKAAHEKMRAEWKAKREG